MILNTVLVDYRKNIISKLRDYVNRDVEHFQTDFSYDVESILTSEADVAIFSTRENGTFYRSWIYDFSTVGDIVKSFNKIKNDMDTYTGNKTICLISIKEGRLSEPVIVLDNIEDALNYI